MTVQVRLDNTTASIVRNGVPVYKNGSIAQDAGRTTTLYSGTVMAYNSTTKLWSPFTVLNNTAGLSTPRGIYVGDDIPAASLVAGNITNCPILVGGAAVEVDESLVIFDQGLLDADDIIAAAAANPFIVLDVRGCLGMFNLYLVGTVEISGYER